jgi:hypothetical protein
MLNINEQVNLLSFLFYTATSSDTKHLPKTVRNSPALIYLILKILNELGNIFPATQMRKWIEFNAGQGVTVSSGSSGWKSEFMASLEHTMNSSLA